MTLFNDRERAFELKYVHDLEMRFRVRMLGARMLAEWAAQQMNLPSGEAEAYINDATGAHLHDVDALHLIDRVYADLKTREIEVDQRQLGNLLATFSAQALDRLGGVESMGTARFASPEAPH